MNIKIVTDSGSNILSLQDVPFAAAPLTIITSEKQYLDDANLNVRQMAEELKVYRGKSSTACPGVGDWLDAFGDAEYVVAIAITGTLSGSYNAACLAKNDYEEEHPGRRVFVLDSLSAGPQMQVLVEKVIDYIKEGNSFDEICEKLQAYHKKTGLVFMLESMVNLANNGRVSPLIAKAAGLLGIRVVGLANANGELEMLEKCRGEKKGLVSALKHMQELEYHGGKVRIRHGNNESAALKLKEMILAEYPQADVEVDESRGLCTFYAEVGGIMIGYEK